MRTFLDRDILMTRRLTICTRLLCVACLFAGVGVSRAEDPLATRLKASDLGETHDVAGAHPEIVAEMERIFADVHTPSALWQFGGAKRD